MIVEEVGLSKKARLKGWGVLPNLGRPAENNLSTEVIWFVSQNINSMIPEGEVVVFTDRNGLFLPVPDNCPFTPVAAAASTQRGR